MLGRGPLRERSRTAHKKALQVNDLQGFFGPLWRDAWWSSDPPLPCRRACRRPRNVGRHRPSVPPPGRTRRRAPRRRVRPPRGRRGRGTPAPASLAPVGRLGPGRGEPRGQVGHRRVDGVVGVGLAGDDRRAVGVSCRSALRQDGFTAKTAAPTASGTPGRSRSVIRADVGSARRAATPSCTPHHWRQPAPRERAGRQSRDPAAGPRRPGPSAQQASTPLPDQGSRATGRARVRGDGKPSCARRAAPALWAGRASCGAEGTAATAGRRLGLNVPRTDREVAPRRDETGGGGVQR